MLRSIKEALHSAVARFRDSEEISFFRSSIAEVNIEFSNFCNRSCQHCPRDRVSPRNAVNISAATLRKILVELKRVGFSGMVHTHLYNEPLYDFNFWLSSVRLIKESLPNCKLGLTSNGDYLTREMLDAIVALDVDTVNITIYYTTWDRDAQLNKVKEFAGKLGVDGRLDVGEDEMFLRSSLRQTALLIRSVNFEKHGQDRGGLVQAGVRRAARTKPCSLPAWQLNINHLGEVFPCCNVYPRKERNAKYLMGTVSDSSLCAIFSSDKFKRFREQTGGAMLENRAMPDCCKFCTDERD